MKLFELKNKYTGEQVLCHDVNVVIDDALYTFIKVFRPDDQVEVKFAKVTNGILEIALERIVPDHKKPKVIEIQDLILNRQQLKNNS